MSLKDSRLLSPAVAVWSLAALLLLAAGSPLLQSQNDTAPVGTESFSIPDRGGRSTTSSGSADTLRVGYGRIRADAGSSTPSGIAIFGLRQDGVLISEAGVPASEPVLEGRIFAEVNGPVNTGLAIANPNDVPATIGFYFTDTSGTRFAGGSFELGANQQIAKFLDQAPFNGGPSVLGTFTFTSSLPVAVVALRAFTNEAAEFLMTTLPVAPLSSTSSDTVYFPQFADGNGWATQVILVNPTVRTITGTVEFLGQGSATTAASPAVRTLEDGRTGSSFEYSIPPNGSYRIITSNPPGGVSAGSVRAIPDDGHRAPSGLVIFSFTSAGKTLLEAGVPAGPAFRGLRRIVGNARTNWFNKNRTGDYQCGGRRQYGDAGGDESGRNSCGPTGNAVASTVGAGGPFHRRALRLAAARLLGSAPGDFDRRCRHCGTAIADQRKRRTEGNDNISIERDGSFDLGGQILRAYRGFRGVVHAVHPVQRDRGPDLVGNIELLRYRGGIMGSVHHTQRQPPGPRGARGALQRH